jgi:beta-lactamase regulating signal transducer with metallopeptidase domain
MTWMINLMSAVLLTSLTGTILFLVWYAIGRLLEFLGFVNIVYELMKAVLVFWYVPVSYLVLMVDHDMFDRWGGLLLFSPSPAIRSVGIVLFVGWLIGAGTFIGKYIWDNLAMLHRYKNASPIPDNGWDCFDAVCEEMHIRAERVDVVESVHESIPKIIGIRKPVIVMPVAEFADFEYRIIFIHELTHYKQKALWLKHLTAIALAFHFFNPFIWLLDRKVQEWGETACDYESIKYVGDVKTYFEVLFQLAVDEKRKSSLQANLVERKGELETRVLRMKRSYKLMNKKKTWTAALAVAAMMVASTVSVSAATISAGNTYMSLYNASVEEVSKGNLNFNSTEEMVLQYADGLDEGFTETVGEVEMIKKGSRWNSGFIWDISKKASKRTDTFTANKGDTITITVLCSPSDATIHAGIINPDGSRYYVSGTNYFSYQFTCESTGTYCVYVQNMSSEKIAVDGTYIVSSN